MQWRRAGLQPSVSVGHCRDIYLFKDFFFPSIILFKNLEEQTSSGIANEVVHLNLRIELE